MKSTRMLLALCLGAALCTASATAGPKASPVFERLKSLVGEWQGKATNGQPATIAYRLISGGTCLEETVNHGEGSMTTIYCPDGDAVMMTHYCMANNQPRMRATKVSADGKTVAFTYVDATNLAGPDAGRMSALVMKLPDADHLAQEWTWREKGKDPVVETFTLERAR